MERTEADTRQDTLYKYIHSVNAGLEAKLVAVNDVLQSKRTFWGWARDVGGNLIVNLVTILAIGALVFGYRFLGELQQSTEKHSGLGPGTSAPQTPAQQNPQRR